MILSRSKERVLLIFLRTASLLCAVGTRTDRHNTAAREVSDRWEEFLTILGFCTSKIKLIFYPKGETKMSPGYC